MRTTTRFLFIAILALAAALPGISQAGDQEAAAAFAEGNRLLTAADFQGAVKSYEAAAKAAPANQEYGQQFAIVRRVMQLREMLPQQTDAQKWERIARALHSFYYWNGVNTEALELDKELHQRLNNSETAAILAETQLALGMNAEVLDLLKERLSGPSADYNRALYAIALARQGDHKEAGNVASRIETPKDPNGSLMVLMARLHALTGNKDEAMKYLAQAMEQTPPSMVPAVRSQAQACADFSGMAQQPVFAQALATQSKIPQSSCSGGSSCGSCSSASSCGKSGGAAASGSAGTSPGCGDKAGEGQSGCGHAKTSADVGSAKGGTE